MIKKAQIVFISITMSTLLFVFALIYGATALLIHSVNEYYIDKLLTDTTSSFAVLKEDAVQENSFIVLLTHNLQTDETRYDYWYDADSFSEQTVNEIIKVAINKPYNSGSVGKVRYKISAIDNVGQKYLLVAYDTTENSIAVRQRANSSLIFLLIVYGVLFYVVYRVSFRVFDPIKQTLKKQKQFISNASHELKTPLAIISANAEVLKDDQNSQWVKNIQSQTDRMNMLVTDMLTLAKMDEGNINLSKMEFDLSSEITNTALPFDAVAFEKGRTIELDVCPEVKLSGDLQSLKTIVNILLDNAIKHSSENSTIYVKLKKENGKTVFSVENSGSSVPDEDSNKVFERFYRGDKSRSRDSGGSGLGLSIAKSIADANKWKISARSRLNESMVIKVIF
ncbi:MAG: GHKL domain-containing protein [Clostridiales bacterium]|nr:GHKL domain-containing protein [Clostridiales bacterium]